MLLTLNAENPSRALAYVRVSSQRQVDEGVSIEAQIKRIKEYARYKGLEISDRDIIIEEGVKGGVKEVVLGMAHRGRLNTLAHIFGKPYREIFSEFEGKEYDDEGIFDGDVKYHLGYTKTVKADSGAEVNLTLCPNPSHLEAVNPVVEGLSRSKIDLHLDNEKEIIPILIRSLENISLF